MATPRKTGLLSIIGPGILLAATGVGAGDLATAAFTGNALGTTVLWAVILGAVFKYVLTEGLTRWQLVTQSTLLDGAIQHLGKGFTAFFAPYLILWTFFVGSALMAACGVAAHALFPIFEEATTGKMVFALVHSALGVLLVWVGGYRLFEKIMTACIGLMTLTVLITAVRLNPDWGAIAQGLLIPRIPEGGLAWTLALVGGVGGTLTLLCYGYWIREEGHKDPQSLKACRIDIASGYTMTALFGIAMVIIGSQCTLEGKGAGLIVALAGSLEEVMGPGGRMLFLIGAWGALFSSLLGVWQSTPYIFCNLIYTLKEVPASQRSYERDTRYKAYLIAMALVPALALQFDFKTVQQYYAIFGACFLPLLATTLLLLNTPAKHLGEHRNRLGSTLALLACNAFFLYALWQKISTTFLAAT